MVNIHKKDPIYKKAPIEAGVLNKDSSKDCYNVFVLLRIQLHLVALEASVIHDNPSDLMFPLQKSM